MPPELVMHLFMRLIRCSGKGRGKETLTVTKDAQEESPQRLWELGLEEGSN